MGRLLLFGALLLCGCGLAFYSGCARSEPPAAALAAAAPRVTGTWPEDGAVAVPREVRMRVTFDRDMDTGTLVGAIKMRARDAHGAAVAVAPTGAAYDAGLRSLFVQAQLPPGVEVELTVGTQATARDGEPLREPAVSWFLVEDDPRTWWTCRTAPAALGRGRDGWLLFRDRPVPPIAGTMATPAGVFNYRIRRADDEDSGWIKMDGPLRLGTGGGVEVGAAELAAGRYTANVAGRRPGTPLTWVHLADNSGGEWLDPEKIFSPR